MNSVSFDIKCTRQGLRTLAEPGKLDIKRREPGILLETSDNDIIIEFRVDSMSLTTSFKKVQRHDDLIKVHAMR